MLAPLFAMACDQPAAAQEKPATPEAVKAEKETRYLAFQIFTYGPNPLIATMGEGTNPQPARFPDKAVLRDYIEDIKQRIGTVGDQQTRLAVMLGPLSALIMATPRPPSSLSLDLNWPLRPMWLSVSISTIQCSGRSARTCGAIRITWRPWTGTGHHARAES